LGTNVRRSISFTDGFKACSNIEVINVQLDTREQMVQDLITQLSPGLILTK
jgi:hypothetical protein